jgi:hypothetical protein
MSLTKMERPHKKWINEMSPKMDLLIEFITVWRNDNVMFEVVVEEQEKKTQLQLEFQFVKLQAHICPLGWWNVINVTQVFWWRQRCLARVSCVECGFIYIAVVSLRWALLIEGRRYCCVITFSSAYLLPCWKEYKKLWVVSFLLSFCPFTSPLTEICAHLQPKSWKLERLFFEIC